MIQVNAMGDACPIPVVKTNKAIQELNGSGVVETLVDNEIAVQNLTKMAVQKGYEVRSEKVAENAYRVEITVSEKAADTLEVIACAKKPENTVVVISSPVMGSGDDTLGAILIKGFIYALSQQEKLPATILFYNGGVKLACEDSPAIEDLKNMEEAGVEIMSCGTCLNHYGLTDKLQVGTVTNMYSIVEKMTGASLIVKP